MASGSAVAFVRDIQTLFDSGTASGLFDRQLLERCVSQRGPAAEAAFEVLVLRMVQGQMTIAKIVPSGAAVKKGQVVCELDSAMLVDQLVNQRITLVTAQANYENSKLAREVAEIAVVEYVEGIFKIQHQETEGNIKIAAAEFAFAEDKKLERQIAACAIVAPRDGTVRRLVGEASIVHERQPLFVISPAPEKGAGTQ